MPYVTIVMHVCVHVIYMHINYIFMKVFYRLNRLGLCLSHSRTIKMIRQLGEEHDA